jgi:hypothetical protein
LQVAEELHGSCLAVVTMRPNDGSLNVTTRHLLGKAAVYQSVRSIIIIHQTSQEGWAAMHVNSVARHPVVLLAHVIHNGVRVPQREAALLWLYS